MNLINYVTELRFGDAIRVYKYDGRDYLARNWLIEWTAADDIYMWSFREERFIPRSTLSPTRDHNAVSTPSLTEAARIAELMRPEIERSRYPSETMPALFREMSRTLN
jgi:hypothetical protein